MPSLPFSISPDRRPEVPLNSDLFPMLQDLQARGFTPRAMQDILANFSGSVPRGGPGGADLGPVLDNIRGQAAGLGLQDVVQRVDALERLIRGANLGDMAALNQKVAHLQAMLAGLGAGGWGASYRRGEPRSVTDTIVNGDVTSVFDFGQVSFPQGFELELTLSVEVNGGTLLTIQNITVAGKSAPYLNGTGSNAFRSSSAGRQIVVFPTPAVGQLVITCDCLSPSSLTCYETMTLWARGEDDSTGRFGPNS